jgi:catechol 2,3-dioxygenase-like lactoylglutathione lyase family enzyme
MNFNHAILYVAEIERSVRYYTGILRGASVLEQDNLYARLLLNGGSTLGFHVLKPGMVSPFKEGMRLYFETEDLIDECERLEELGYHFDRAREKMAWGWEQAYLTDPDGHQLCIYYAGAVRTESKFCEFG